MNSLLHLQVRSITTIQNKSAELERGGYKLLTFDLESVSFMDSSGIGIVLGRYKVVSKGGGRLRIINANRRVERILRMAGIFSIAEYRQRRA